MLLQCKISAIKKGAEAPSQVLAVAITSQATRAGWQRELQVRTPSGS
jgi:hypothetical protein